MDTTAVTADGRDCDAAVVTTSSAGDSTRAGDVTQRRCDCKGGRVSDGGGINGSDSSDSCGISG